MKYKAILFDMNGVLVDDEPLQEAAFHNVLKSIGISLSPEDYTRFFIGKTDRKGFEDYFSAKGIDEDIDNCITTKGHAYLQLTSLGIKGFLGTEEFVVAAYNAGLSMAVVTSSMRKEAETVLSGLRLSDYIPTIVAAEDIKNSKPNPEGYLKAAALLSVSHESCVVIEDAPSGIQAAKAAGMFSIAVTNTHPVDMLHDADLIVDHLSRQLLDDLMQ